MAALHASRQPPMQWIPLDRRMVPIRNLEYNPAHPDQGGTNIPEDISERITNAGNNAYLNAKRRSEMLAVSRFYFDRAIDGHLRSLAELTVENIEAVYVAATLAMFHAVFVLSESDEDSTLPSVDALQWMRLGKGARWICERWAALVGPDWITSSGVFYEKPGMIDETALFNTEHGRPFLKLLTYAQDFETITAEDRKVYREAISYAGSIYTGIMEHTEDEMIASRRLMGTPASNDPRFADFVEAKQPRAMAILAHVYACMKLIAEKIPWFNGIAERQIPKIYEELPVGWKPMLAWPLAIMNGEIDREPTETQIDDVLAF
ncbi:uncharacterized protein LTR77_006442 [Saxophila tyrrhenica]|uniref:Uncharacterized protein n=1 Tax=Saxophila tyrrhenica TaxID=1690608 RepID=A0AAV9P7W4_9PEZI|nr:hypothetical protein LTR77_006442 [Saxophila tyrrhenica]